MRTPAASTAATATPAAAVRQGWSDTDRRMFHGVLRSATANATAAAAAMMTAPKPISALLRTVGVIRCWT